MNKEILRRVQLTQLEIAKEIKRVCEKNKLNVFLVSGTLLGAIRHKGFIPWDDDMDMAMMREDYNRFIQIASKELDARYAVVEWRMDSNYPHPMAKVIKKGTVFKEWKRRDRSQHGIWVDIFPYDVAPNDYRDRQSQKVALILNRALARSKCGTITWYDNNTFVITKWLKNLPVRILSLFITKDAIVKNYEHAAQKYNRMNSEYYYDNGCDEYERNLIPKKCITSLIDVEFEDTTFKAPIDYDLYLKTLYGDYMKLPPEEKRENRHMIEKVSFEE